MEYEIETAKATRKCASCGKPILKHSRVLTQWVSVNVFGHIRKIKINMCVKCAKKHLTRVIRSFDKILERMK